MRQGAVAAALRMRYVRRNAPVAQLDRALPSEGRGQGFESLRARQSSHVRPGHMGDRSYLRHGWQPRAERVVEGLQGSLLQVEVAEIVVHEADEPNALVNLLDSEPLAGQRA